jgi:NNP family nitrate/nitrite transporter-like MFS transporter
MWLWLSVAPLQIAIKNTTGITENQLNTASTCSILGSMFARLLAGAMTDKYGASRPMIIALIVASLSTGLTSLVSSGGSLSICRLVSGVGGSTLIIAQAWTAAMFSKNIIGTATGLVLGIGYTGAGFAIAFLGSVLFPALSVSMSENKSWRLCLVISGAVGLLTALIACAGADDTPRKKFYTREESSCEQGSSILCKIHHGPIIQAGKHPETWILAMQYTCSSGANSALLNLGVLYFVNVDGAAYAEASGITSVVGWLGLTCFVGGLISDRANTKMGLRGRYLVQLANLGLEGILLVIFPFVTNFGASAFIFIAASMMATWAVGSTGAMVPYVDREVVGSVSGIVGFGGGLGGIFMLLLYSAVGYKLCCVIMGTLVIISACMSLLLRLDDGDTNNIATEDKSDSEEVEKNRCLNKIDTQHEVISSQ